MLLPAMGAIAAFMFYPIFNTFWLSFQNHVLTDRMGWGFAGLDNFVRLFQDDVLWKSLKNTAVWTIVNVVLQTVLGLLVALLLNRPFKGRGIARALSFSPWAVGGILVALIWGFMMSESVGVINDVLMKLRLVSGRVSWFSSERMAMSAIIIANTWRGIPFFAISILSSLQTIPGEIYESAEVDGASVFGRFFHITLPLIKDTLVLTTLLRTIWTFNVIDIIYGMTRGGPNFSTLTVPTYIMMIFSDSLDMGYASTVAVMMMAIMLVFSALYLKAGAFGKEGNY
jgi:multiple sugar transport system permease protein